MMMKVVFKEFSLCIYKFCTMYLLRFGCHSLYCLPYLSLFWHYLSFVCHTLSYVVTLSRSSSVNGCSEKKIAVIFITIIIV